MKNLRFLKFVILLSFFFLSACAKITLHQNLTENDANEIMVALHDRGIEAKKVMVEKSTETSWSVQVQGKDEPLARKILVENKLPKVKEGGFAGICKEKGLIPTPEEEKCRRLLALKGEIINSLERIPGVVDADVVLNIPDVSEFAVESQPNKHPTASVVIRVRKNIDGNDLTEAKVQRFISNTVENLDPRDVAAIITYVESPSLVNAEKNVLNFINYMGIKISPDSKNRFKIYALSTLGVFVFLSAALLFTVFRLIQLRQSSKPKDPDSGMHSDSNLLAPPSGEVPLISEMGSK